MRRRLAAVFAAVTTMVAIAFIVPLAFLVRDVAEERALDDADRDVSALFPVLALTDDPVALDVAISRTRAGSERRLDVHFADGRRVGSDRPASERVASGLREGRAFSGVVDGGAEIVAPVVREGGDIAVVRVFVPSSELQDGVTTAWLALGGVGVALIAGSVLLADRLARSVIRPVGALAAASHRLGAGDLTARVEPAGPPEIAEVGEAFNQLAGRVDGLLHAEREDVADLAHRLRTPLTALRLQIDQVSDPDLRSQLARSADDLGRSLDRVIAEARRVTDGTLDEYCDIVEVVAERTHFWQALADDQGRATAVDLPETALRVRVSRNELAAAIDVVLENVYAHTPDGTPYRVAVHATDGIARITVDDEGVGFPDAAVVGRGESRGASSGLGLDIAKRTAEHAGGQLLVGRSVPHGAQVELRLPLVGGAFVR